MIDFDAHFDSTGFYTGESGHTILAFHLVGLNNNRVLIDCAMSGADGAAFYMNGDTQHQAVVAQNGRVAFVTHPIAQSALLYVVIEPTPSPITWVFTGCEFTPLPPA